MGEPLSLAPQPLPHVATTVAGHAQALPAPPHVPPVNTGGDAVREERAAGSPASAALVVAPGYASAGVPDTPQTPQTPFSDGDTPMSGAGAAAPELDPSRVEAMAAEAERQAANARASAASALALKAASKILADRRKPRQTGTA